MGLEYSGHASLFGLRVQEPAMAHCRFCMGSLLRHLAAVQQVV